MLNQTAPFPPSDLSVKANAEIQSFLPVDSSGDMATSSAKGTFGTLPTISRLQPKWRYLWKTPSTIIALFLLAWIFALIHLLFFRFLNNRLADGPSSIPQTYVATLSHLLGLLFRASLSGSLAVAFTQYLWRLMRVNTVQVSSIELLFKITHNPFLLAMPEVVKTTPILFSLALVAWLMPLAVTFPPGSLIVVSTPVSKDYLGLVPTYNSTVSESSKSPADIIMRGGVWWYRAIHPQIRRISRLTLENGEIVPSISPCGLDCSYSIQFEGPFLQCKDEVIINQDVPCYTNCRIAAFTYDDVGQLHPKVGTTINMSTSRPLDGCKTHEIKSISCVPSRASFTVDVAYKAGIRTISHSAEYIGSFDDTISRYNNADNQFSMKTPVVKEMIIAYNHFAFIGALVEPLQGNYTIRADGYFSWSNDAENPTFTPCYSTPGNILIDTRFNMERDNYTRSQVEGPVFNISHDLLNEALFNLTMNAAFQLEFWNDTVPIRATNFSNIYSFAKPEQLIVPYLACLLVAGPFLALGILSVHQNGVSAIQGGFLQITMTMINSQTLKGVVGSGCLGGEENVPDALKNLKVRFGEIVRVDDTDGPRTASFGTDDEVVALRRDVTYGS